MSFFSVGRLWFRRFHRPRRKVPFVRKPLVFEGLEERTVPSALPTHITPVPGTVPSPGPGSNPDPNAGAYVTGLYYDVLNREPQQSEVDSWVSVLNAGASRAQVAQDFIDSTEYRLDLIRNDYQSYLGRRPDQLGLDLWFIEMEDGVGAQQLAAGLVSSNEYFADQGGTPAGWLTGLYRDILGRSPDAAGLQAWEQILQGSNRLSVATAFVDSPESENVQIAQAYQKILGRTPDAAGQAAWAAAMAQGMTLEQVEVGIASSQEFYDQQQGVDLPVLGGSSTDSASSNASQDAAAASSTNSSSDTPNQPTGSNPGSSNPGASAGNASAGSQGATGTGTPVAETAPGADAGSGAPASGAPGSTGGGAGGEAPGTGGAGSSPTGQTDPTTGGNAGSEGSGAPDGTSTTPSTSGNNPTEGPSGGPAGSGGSASSEGGASGGQSPGTGAGGTGGAGSGGTTGMGPGGGSGSGSGLGGGTGGGSLPGGGIGVNGIPSGGSGSGVGVGSGTTPPGSSSGDGQGVPVLDGISSIQNIPISNDSSLDYSEISMAVNPLNPLNMVVTSEDINVFPNHADTWYTLNGGKTWTLVRLDGVDGITGANVLRSDPTVAFDSLGRVYVGYLILSDDSSDTSGTSYMFVAHSTDGGKTYKGSFVVADNRSGNVTNDKELLATGPAPGNPSQVNVYLAWVRFDNLGENNQTSKIEISGSVDGGVTWSSPTFVDANDTETQFATPRVGPNGQIYVSYIAGDGVRINESNTFSNGQFKFGPDHNVVTFNIGFPQGNSVPAQPHRDINALPVLAVDDSPGPYRGRLYITYADIPKGGASPNFDIWLVSSSDGGVTWTAPVKVNDDSGDNTHFNPWISVDPETGGVSLEWRDTREDPTNHQKTDIFTTTSANGGKTFAPNIRVSDASSDVSSDPNPNDYLEYDGFAAFGAETYFAFADNSNDLNGVKRILFAEVPTGLPILTATGTVTGNATFGGQTSNTATYLGVLTGTQIWNNLAINTLPNGLPDNNWYLWTAGNTGAFTARIDYTPGLPNPGDLDLRVFTINANNDLIQLGASLNSNVTDQVLSVVVTDHEPLYVWIYGFNHATASYKLTVSLT
jgi:Domain of unknown function (DUF4214)